MTDPPKKLGKGPLDIPALVFALVAILVFVMLWAVCGVLDAMVGGWVRAAPPRARHPPLPESGNSARCCQVWTSLTGPRPSLASRAAWTVS
jgi:hypothetical protein